MRGLARADIAVSFVLLTLLGASDGASAQLGSRPASQWAITLESGRRLDGLEIQRVVSLLGLQAGDVVADIGAGTGVFSVPMALAVGPAGTVLAVEVDAGFLSMIAEKAREGGVSNVVPVVGEFEDPMLPRLDVDVAFFHDVLHHIEGRQEYLRTLAGYMAPQSRIMVVDYDMNVEGVPHSNQPEMLIGPDQVDQWMTIAGFVRTREFDIFDDKFFVVYTKVD